MVNYEIEFIRKLYPNGVIKMMWTNDIDDSEYESNNESINCENRIVQEIMSCTVIAAYDALIDNDTIASV